MTYGSRGSYEGQPAEELEGQFSKIRRMVKRGWPFLLILEVNFKEEREKRRGEEEDCLC